MTTTGTPIDQVSAIDHTEARALAVAENGRFVELVTSLSADDWSKQTECPAWDVKAMTCHVLGAMEGHVSIQQFIHQVRAGKKAAGERPDVDGMTEVQVRERLQLEPAQITALLTDLAPRAARARTRLPGIVRRITMKVEVDKAMEPWSLGYLFDVILTRDTWMHRIDISRATTRPLLQTGGHDGRIVADVVAEWARRHGRPFTLHLEGPAGGHYNSGRHGEEITIDAIEFCRTVAGRATGEGLLRQQVPF